MQNKKNGNLRDLLKLLEQVGEYADRNREWFRTAVSELNREERDLVASVLLDVQDVVGALSSAFLGF